MLISMPSPPLPGQHPLHGPAFRHPLYCTYAGMVARCTNKNHCKYSRYGARGIRVCDRWAPGQPFAQGFWNFVEDMGEKLPKTTLDRIDNDGPYHPENCRWATCGQQMSTRQTCRGEDRATKLTEKDVQEIFWLHRMGARQKEIVQAYGISSSHCSSLLSGKKWKSVKT